MLNVLHISPGIYVKGGIGTVLQNYLATDLPRICRLYFVSSHKDGSKYCKYYFAFAGLLSTLRILLREKIDIVHIHCGDTTSTCRKYFYFRIAQIFKKKIILHLHASLFLKQFKEIGPFWRLRLRRFFEESNLVICLSKSWFDDIGLIFPGTKRIVVPNGIILPDLNSHSNCSGEITITFLGIIGHRKGVFDLLKAFKDLTDEGLPISLKIGGNGEVSRLNRAIHALGLEGRVEYLGWITGEDKDSLLRKTDIYVLPSYGEGMPMSILEAMSYGIPILSTYVGGISELVEDGRSGFLIKPGDIDALRSNLRLLAEDRGLRRDLGIAARRCLETGHDIHLIARKLACVYQALAAQGSKDQSDYGSNLSQPC
jgi:glycosyltransferase involved in cell wall biosynthesis